MTIAYPAQRIDAPGSSYVVEMKPICAWLLVGTLSCVVNAARAQLQTVPDPAVPQIFGGMPQKVNVRWYNAGETTVRADIHAQLYQTTSATAVSWGSATTTPLEVLPQQTVLESVPLTFPAVRAKTRFLLQWSVGSNRPPEPMEIFVYPTNLLNELNSLVHGDDLGVLDPNDRIKPLLTQSSIEFLDLGTVPLETFDGRLAIIGPFEKKTQMRAGLGAAIQKIAAAGVAVVWLQSPANSDEDIKPSYCVVSANKAAVVVVQPELIASVASSPQAQLNLVYLCKLSLNPATFSLPNLTSQP